MNRSTKKIAFLDRFYKKLCCGAKNHPSSWKKDKRIASKATRRKLKGDLKIESEGEAYPGWILNSSDWGGENAYEDTLEDLVNEAPTIIEADKN